MMFAAALLMSSCGLYSKYERPDVNTDGVIRQWTDGADSLLVNDTTSFGNLPILCCKRSYNKDSTITSTCSTLPSTSRW